jgi:hypothetical protein
MTPCTICQRTPARRNRRNAPSAHIDCPHRKPEVITPADMRMLDYPQLEFKPDLYGKPFKKERPPLHCKSCGSPDVRWRLQGGEWTMFSM